MSDVSNQNITLSLPEEDLREARILAASRGTSVSQLLARMLRELVERETGYARARDRSLARLREGTDLGTGGTSTGVALASMNGNRSMNANRGSSTPLSCCTHMTIPQA